MLACAQLLTGLGVPSAVAWAIDGALFAAAAVAGVRLFIVGRRPQPPVVAEAERILAEAASATAGLAGVGPNRRAESR